MLISDIESENVLICSDLHLGPKNPTITDFFCNWALSYFQDQNLKDRPEWLLILGDLFDHWVGDDLINSSKKYEFKNAIEELKKCFLSLKELNVSVGIMHGNRDFLMGETLLSYIHAKHLAPTLKLRPVKNNHVVLLVHGDELCTDDTQHQVFRELVKTSDWQNKFKSKPLDERQKIAKSLRENSEVGKKNKALEIMDINPETADCFLQENNAHVLIHGHTHLPGKNILPSGKFRWVITNWIIDVNGKVSGGGIQVKGNEINQIFT